MADLFRTREHVADFDTYVSKYRERSAATRSRLRVQLDIAYGPGQDERLDLFFPGNLAAPAPIHLFIHGGYWRMFGKADFSFVADTITQAGAIAAIMDYSLMPAVRMETIVQQVKLAFDWLASNAMGFGGDGARLSVSGHSAGGHLGALLLAETNQAQPVSSLLQSGIYELEPLRHSFLQPEIGLTEEEIARFSPLRLPIRPTGSVRILVGEHETEPFHTQAQQLAQMTQSAFTSIIGGNHMSVALDLGDPSTVAGKALLATCS
jgi:arylformamidase